MTSIVEGLTSGSQNYRHIYCRMSADGGNSWGDFNDITGSIIHNFNECVFPSVASRSNDRLHLIFQMDDEPGLAVRGDEDPYGDNSIVYSSVPKSDIGVGVRDTDPVGLWVSDAYPNPATDQATIMVTVNKPVELTLQMMDVSGRMVQNINKGKGLSGTQYFNLNCHHLPRGLYFYTVNAGGSVASGKLIIQ